MQRERAGQVGIGVVHRADPAVELVAEHVGREQRRRQQHQRVQRRDRAEDEQRRQAASGSHGEQVRGEHRDDHDAQASAPQVKPGGAERSCEPDPPDSRRERLGKELARVRRRQIATSSPVASSPPTPRTPSQLREALLRASSAGARSSKLPLRAARSGGLFTLIASSLPDGPSARVWSLLPLR